MILTTDTQYALSLFDKQEENYLLFILASLDNKELDDKGNVKFNLALVENIFAGDNAKRKICYVDNSCGWLYNSSIQDYL